ncbi:MAG: hypothetical protein ACTSRR_05005 [Candidatus Heimdallarchaeaceae archaeon]
MEKTIRNRGMRVASLISLYKLSKRVYHESILHSQLESSGSNIAKLLERIGKNPKIISSQPKIMKFLSSFYILFLTIIPIRSITVVNFIISSNTPSHTQIPQQWLALVGSMMASAFLLLEPFILIIFSIMMTWGLFSPEIYAWPQTLPLRKKDIEKLSLLTFIRGINIQLLFMILVLPLGIAIGILIDFSLYLPIMAFLLIFTALIISIVSAFFNLGTVVFISKKMYNLMAGKEDNSGKSSIIKTTISLLYLISSMTLMYIIQISIEKIPNYFTKVLLSDEQSLLVNNILSFIPFPFSGGYLITILVTNHSLYFSPITVIGSITGLIIFAILTYFLMKHSISTLLNTPKIKSDSMKEKKDEKEIIVQLQTTSPLKAFIRRDLSIISRDMQLIMVFVMPIIIPIFAVITDIEDNVLLNDAGLTGAFISILFYIALTTYMIITGVTNIESGGETITSSIPIRTRDQVKSKIPYFFTSILLAFLIWHLFFINEKFFSKMIVFCLVYLPAIPLAGIGGLFFKILMFGKLRYKYVVEEIKTEHRFIKHISSFLFVLLSLLLFMGLSFLGYGALGIGEIVYLILLIIVFNHMFPK